MKEWWIYINPHPPTLMSKKELEQKQKAIRERSETTLDKKIDNCYPFQKEYKDLCWLLWDQDKWIQVYYDSHILLYEDFVNKWGIWFKNEWWYYFI